MASVDVAVPCYQYGRYLPGCVASVLSQGVDDVPFSSSTTHPQITAWTWHGSSPRPTSEFPWSPTPPISVHASFDEGIDWASADYFILLCADDLLAPNCLKRAVAVMEERPDIVLTFGRELIITSDVATRPLRSTGRGWNWQILTGGELLERICRTGRPDASVFIISNATAVVRTAAQKRVGHYRTELPHWSDPRDMVALCLPGFGGANRPYTGGSSGTSGKSERFRNSQRPYVECLVRSGIRKFLCP